MKKAPHHTALMPHAAMIGRDGVLRNRLLPVPAEQRFWKFVDKRGDDECWMWTGNATGSCSKYASFWDGKKEAKGHRFSYELHYGKIPKGMFACHRCDTPLCVNPKHIFIGTPKDNQQDSVRKGRKRYGILCGEANARSKYKERQVLEVARLFKQGKTRQQIADVTGITRASVSAIVEGRVWSRVTGFSRPIYGVRRRLL